MSLTNLLSFLFIFSNMAVSLFRRILNNALPFRHVLTSTDYWRVKNFPPFKEGIAKVHGHPILFSDKDGFLHSVKEIFVEEVYRFHSKTDAPVILDVGANIGLSIIYFKKLYPRARIIAYEPDPTIFNILERNVATLSLGEIELRNAAAWVEDTTLIFYREGSLAGSTEIDFLSKGLPVKVPAERLKQVLRGKHVDFLKIDIEGAENSVLFDIESCLANVDNLFFEYHSQPDKIQQLDELLNLVRRAGFRYVINGPHCVKFPFVERVEHGFDMQLNVSCFRPEG